MSGKGAAEEGSNEAQGKKRARSAEIGTDGEFTGIPIKNRIIDEARSLSERVRRWGENAYFGGPDMRKTDEFRKGIWPANFDNHDDAMRYGESMRKNSETPTAEEEEEANDTAFLTDDIAKHRATEAEEAREVALAAIKAYREAKAAGSAEAEELGEKASKARSEAQRAKTSASNALKRARVEAHRYDNPISSEYRLSAKTQAELRDFIRGEARAGSRSRNSSPFRHQTPGQYQPVRQGSGYTTSGGSTRRGRKSKSRRSKSKRSKRSKKSKKSKRTRRGKTRR